MYVWYTVVYCDKRKDKQRQKINTRAKHNTERERERERETELVCSYNCLLFYHRVTFLDGKESDLGDTMHAFFYTWNGWRGGVGGGVEI